MSSDTKNTPIAELRQRMWSWNDPHIGTATSKTMSGLDYIRALIDGSVPPPPIVILLRMRAVSAEAGQVTFHCDPDESMYHPIGAVHGGAVCALLDSVLGSAVQSALPAVRGTRPLTSPSATFDPSSSTLAS
ncbi:MAG: aromatic compound degradation protein PaaI [Glaciihabitans sp.]|nr:aromatic compound degradation protein PaaI [Glaciihabitans sp.]